MLPNDSECEWSGEDEDEGDQEERLTKDRSILWLCQDGQFQLARQRIFGKERQDRQQIC